MCGLRFGGDARAVVAWLLARQAGVTPVGTPSVWSRARPDFDPARHVHVPGELHGRELVDAPAPQDQMKHRPFLRWRGRDSRRTQHRWPSRGDLSSRFELIRGSGVKMDPPRPSSAGRLDRGINEARRARVGRPSRLAPFGRGDPPESAGSAIGGSRHPSAGRAIGACSLGTAADRPDPVSLLERQDATRVAELVPIRYGRMLASPLEFLRGSAVVMASDFTHTPITGLTTQICGDAHLSNFGMFAAPDRDLVFNVFATISTKPSRDLGNGM